MPGKLDSATRTRVFWDVVDLPFPSGLSPKEINDNMKLVLQRFGYGDGDLSIMAYVYSETSLVPPDKSAYKDAGTYAVLSVLFH
ncbi:hypothetical protein Bca52824_089494 [Brassica carinata]|uniref:NYN domain-containing protein n=1 Tax=Brassica carinata TaxID=52824 RepID=A0A8X7PDD8_BRACI|nr:hypothetical protein Bca52824_089494 [Brassica carinata]